MIGHPKTIKEAREYNYGISPGPGKISYYEGCCAYEVSGVIAHYRVSRQCLKKNGHGPGLLYCKQHAMIVEEAANA